ncbi:MAG: hypothetical protein SFV15_26105 [Polyangiaceae bacterium]|nr:hypothetical protein [Polyangiaceae bacterium]
MLALLGQLAACVGPAKAPNSPRTKEASQASAKSVPLALACSTPAPETCFNATDDNCNGLIDEGCGSPLGPIQVVAAWADVEADVELVVIDPNLEASEVGHFVASGLTKDRDCPGEGALCKGINVEHVTLPEGEPLRGTYTVRVSLERLGTSGSPVKVRLGFHFGPRMYAYGVRLKQVGEAAVFRADL